MSKFDQNFIFHENGGPFPGSCVRCGDIKKLWNIGMVPGSTITALFCDKCLTELAIFAGFVTSKSYAELNATKSEIIEKQKAQIEAAPKLMEKFSNDITNIIGDFVTSVASVAVPSKPVQPQSDQAGAGNTEQDSRISHPSGGSKSSTSKPSTKPSVN